MDTISVELCELHVGAAGFATRGDHPVLVETNIGGRTIAVALDLETAIQLREELEALDLESFLI